MCLKKIVFAALSISLICLSFAGCSSGPTQSEYQAVVDEKKKLESQVSVLQSENSDLQSQLAAAEEKLSATPTPAPTPTPEPTPEPTPSPTPEPEMTEEEFKASCTAGYDYKELARDPKTYIGKPAQFRGEIIQVLEDDGVAEYRINVTEGDYGIWQDTIYVIYFPKEGEKRLLEDDIVTVYGEMTDLVTYKTVMGGSLSIPGMLAKYIDLA